MEFMYYLKAQRTPSRVISAHFHNYYEIVYYYGGTGKVFYKQNEDSAYTERKQLVWVDKLDKNCPSLDFSSGVMHIIEPNTVHNEIHDANLSEVLAIGFSLDDKSSQFFRTGSVYDKRGKLKDIMLAIEDEFTRKEQRYDQNIEAYITLALNEFLRLEESKTAEDRSGIDYALNYFDEYFMTDINIDFIARGVGYCADHFRVLFKKKYGVSPKRYILNKRLNYARNLIETSDLPLNTIAESCGYDDYFQFNAIFKKTFGYPPSSLTKKKSDEPSPD